MGPGRLTFNISEPILAGLSVTMTPAASNARTLSTAAPVKQNQLAPYSAGSQQIICQLTFSSGYNGASMPHPAPWWSGTSRDEPDDRFRVTPGLVIPLKIICCFLFHGATDLTNENNTFKHNFFKKTLMGKECLLP
jgi:hypothetical protein